jgi:hypothetical protein
VTVSAITTDADLVAFVPAHARKRLTPPDWTDWTYWHNEAWTDILRHLRNLPDPVLEADLALPTEFKAAAVHHVAQQAFAYGADQSRADYHRREYLRLLGLIHPTLSNGSTASALNWGSTVEMERG